MNITDDQIRTLRAEAAQCRDYKQVEVCDHALGGHQGSRADCARVIEGAAAEAVYQAAQYSAR